MPVMRSPARIVHRLVLNDVAMSASPRAAAERVIVFLWVNRHEKNPDPNSVMKYPAEMMRNREPAWPWPMPRSLSIGGSSGAGMILAMKFRKKIEVMKRIGTMCALNDARPFDEALSAGEAMARSCSLHDAVPYVYMNIESSIRNSESRIRTLKHVACSFSKLDTCSSFVVTNRP